METHQEIMFVLGLQRWVKFFQGAQRQIRKMEYFIWGRNGGYSNWPAYSWPQREIVHILMDIVLRSLKDIYPFSGLILNTVPLVGGWATGAQTAGSIWSPRVSGTMILGLSLWPENPSLGEAFTKAQLWAQDSTTQCLGTSKSRGPERMVLAIPLISRLPMPGLQFRNTSHQVWDSKINLRPYPTSMG